MILTISILIFLVSIFWGYLISRNIFSPILLFMGQWIFVFIGSIYFYFDLNHKLTLFYSTIGVLFVVFGAYLANVITKFKPYRELKNYKKNKKFVSTFNKNVFFVTLNIITLLTIFSVFYLFYKNGIPLLNIDIGASKVEIAYGNGLYIRALKTFLPVITIFWYGYYKLYNNYLNSVIFYFIFIINIISLTLYGFKSAVLYFFVYFFIYWQYTSKKIRIKTIIGISLVSVSSGIIIVLLSNNTANIFLALNSLINRATKVQAAALDYIIYNFVPERGFTFGNNFWLGLKGFASTFGLSNEVETFGSQLFKIMNSSSRARFSMTTTLTGDFYVSFGFFGVMIGMALYGFILHLSYIFIIRKNIKDYFFLPIICYFQAVLLEMSVIGAPFAILNDRGISLLVISLMVIGVYLFFILPQKKILLKF